MQSRPDALAQTLQRVIPPLVWVHGDEPLIVMEATDTARSAMRAVGYNEREVIAVERGFKVEQLLEHTQALSLFASQRLIELRVGAKPGKELGEALGAAAAAADDGLRLLVSGPRLDRAATDSAWFNALDRHALIVPVFPVDRAQLPHWIAQRLGRQQQRADADTLRMIAERVEGNLLAAHQEIRKLELLFPAGELPADEVRQAVLNVARYGAFDLPNAILAGDCPRVLRTLDGLRAEGEPEPLVLWALADVARNLARLAEARDERRPLAQAMRELRIFGAREGLYEQGLRRLDTRSLLAAVREAARIDRIVKGLVQEDAWAAMTALAASLAGAPVLTSENVA